jgi:hypothetical protein
VIVILLLARSDADVHSGAGEEDIRTRLRRGRAELVAFSEIRRKARRKAATRNRTVQHSETQGKGYTPETQRTRPEQKRETTNSASWEKAQPLSRLRTMTASCLLDCLRSARSSISAFRRS